MEEVAGQGCVKHLGLFLPVGTPGGPGEDLGYRWLCLHWECSGDKSLALLFAGEGVQNVGLGW